MYSLLYILREGMVDLGQGLGLRNTPTTTDWLNYFFRGKCVLRINGTAGFVVPMSEIPVAIFSLNIHAKIAVI